MRCPRHGVGVQRVPWARAGSGFVYAFEQLCAWLAVRTDKTTLSSLLRIAWRTVGAIVERVAEAALAQFDPLQGLLRIGIDEVAYRKGHYYLTVVLDHDSGRLLWASPGRNEETLHTFFDALGRSAASSCSWSVPTLPATSPTSLGSAAPMPCCA